MKLIWLLGKLIYPFFYLGSLDKKMIIYKLGNKAKFALRVNTVDKLIVWEVWKIKNYIDSEFVIKKDDVVVDIGAHIGAFSVYAAKKATSGKILAYEPDKGSYSLLRKNKHLNDLNNLFLFNLAISGKKGNIDLFIGNVIVNNSIYKYGSKKRIKVKSNTLKDIFTRNNLKRINYLKIDAEGAEYDILLNTLPEVIKKVDKIVIEYHDYLDHTYSYNDLKMYLKDNGFKVSVCGNILLRRILRVGMIKARRKYNT